MYICKVLEANTRSFGPQSAEHDAGMKKAIYYGPSLNTSGGMCNKNDNSNSSKNKRKLEQYSCSDAWEYVITYRLI